MEILISILISSLTQVLKKVVKKIGLDFTKQASAGLVFVLCIISSILYQKGIITWEMINSILQMFLIAVGYYEVVYKKVLEPIFNNLVNNK
jgi:hypothetical protein